eukprot:PhM_4_TR11168/c0_g2_i1/m.3009
MNSRDHPTTTIPPWCCFFPSVTPFTSLSDAHSRLAQYGNTDNSVAVTTSGDSDISNNNNINNNNNNNNFTVARQILERRLLSEALRFEEHLAVLYFDAAVRENAEKVVLKEGSRHQVAVPTTIRSRNRREEHKNTFEGNDVASDHDDDDDNVVDEVALHGLLTP